MPLPVTRLRRWLAAGAILMVAIVAGMYLYARWRVRNAVHEVPQKLGIDIQQTAQGFSISKSEEGRTLFRIDASKAVKFKKGGVTELHDVKIVVYGRDASRFDRIAGDDFEYDPASGDVTAKGTVKIDLEGNPQGLEHPDQAPPEEMKDPIHVEASGLAFNSKSGNGSASGRVEFHTPQASGSAVGIDYVSKTGTMTLVSGIVMDVTSPQAVRLNAERAVITKSPRQIVLSRPRLAHDQRRLRSDRATFFLRDDNTVDSIVAEGDVESEMHGASEATARADRGEMSLTGPRNLLTMAVLSGNVKLASQGERPAEAAAGRVTLHFAGEQILQTVHAEEGVRLTQKKIEAASAGGRAGPALSGVEGTPVSPLPSDAQEVEMSAPVMDFVVKDGHLLESAVTSGPPQIVITQPGVRQRTVVTAAKFTASFTERNRLANLHGAPEAKIVSSKPGQPDRVSTSQALDVAFRPEGGIASIVQQGDLFYVDGTRKAWAQRAIYTPADQMLVLIGSPRVVDSGMTTTADAMRMNRGTGDAIAEGNVKSTYSELKAQPDGGMLAAADPIHVTSRSMTAHRLPGVAVYSGNAVLWQNANVVQAPALEFDREQRSLVAKGSSSQPVSTVLVQIDKNGKATPVTITSTHLTYKDSERRIFLDGGVTVKGADATMIAQQMNVFLAPRNGSQSDADPGTPGRVERIVAEGKVAITQPARHATGDRLVYTASDEKFVLTGGPPSIFDAEHGKITGDSLTFYKRDDRVLVEGRETSPAVTRTQVAR
jgi:lipopolysaccharide export system protein LptA